MRVRGVHLSSRPRELYEASVEQLDYLPPTAGKTSGASTSSSSGAGSSRGGSKEQEELAQELLKVGWHLLWFPCAAYWVPALHWEHALLAWWSSAEACCVVAPRGAGAAAAGATFACHDRRS